MTEGWVQTAIDRVWYSDGVGAAVCRSMLSPLSKVFGLAVRTRNRRYDRLLRVAARATDGLPPAVVPALSVGNLTVGGTGKTPISSWFVSRLSELGARPAIVLRGHGDDEWRVHELLTPGVPVEVNVDRILGAKRAQGRGADCVVYDDGFQHRRARRVSDIVLISADRWKPPHRLLPTGPFREPLTSLRRATAVVITAKAVSSEKLSRVRTEVLKFISAERLAEVAIELGELRLWAASDGSEVERARPIDNLSDTMSASPVSFENLPGLSGLSVVVVSAIGDPNALETQLLQKGAHVVRHFRYPDHHLFSSNDVSHIVGHAEQAGAIVCTLKDAVKLGPLWPRFGPPLWYLSQTIMVTAGADVLERECHRVLAARLTNQPSAGDSRPFNN